MALESLYRVNPLPSIIINKSNYNSSTTCTDSSLISAQITRLYIMSGVNVIRMEEVRKHAGDKESVWFVIHDKVYDVSAFLEDHPGGEEIHMLNSGKICTEEWEDVGHSNNARELMRQYCIGDLHPDDCVGVPKFPDRLDLDAKGKSWSTPPPTHRSIEPSSVQPLEESGWTHRLLPILVTGVLAYVCMTYLV